MLIGWMNPGLMNAPQSVTKELALSAIYVFVPINAPVFIDHWSGFNTLGINNLKAWTFSALQSLALIFIQGPIDFGH